MNITITKQGPVSIVTINGTIMHEDIATIRTRLTDLVSNETAKIVMDLKDVGYLSSKFLAVIIDIKAAVAKKDGDLKIANANQLITNLFDMTRLNKKIELYDSIEKALSRLNKNH
jgi:anti-anti-sigma factor